MSEPRKAESNRDEFRRTLRMTKSLMCNLQNCADCVGDARIVDLIDEARRRLDAADARCDVLDEEARHG